MVGHDIEIGHASAALPRPESATVLERARTSGRTATAACRPSRASRCTVRAGEIVAVAGVAGNGQRELAEAITGLRPCTTGRDRVDGQGRSHNGDARAAFDAGVGYVPEDRLGTGVAPNLSIARTSRCVAYRRRLARAVPAAAADARDAERGDRRPTTSRPRARTMQTDNLSGGNLQKLVIAREFSARDEGARRRLADPRPRRRRRRDGARAPARRGRRERSRRAADQRGPRRDPRAQRPDRRHVRGRADRGRRTARASRRSGCGWPAGAPGRAPSRPTPSRARHQPPSRLRADDRRTRLAARGPARRSRGR